MGMPINQIANQISNIFAAVAERILSLRCLAPRSHSGRGNQLHRHAHGATHNPWNGRSFRESHSLRHCPQAFNGP
jgi:hypothetical protein